MPFLSINNINYHYQIAGAGEPLLLLHGFTGSTANWGRQWARFAEQYQVVAVDILGHGQTNVCQTAVSPDPDRYTMPLVAADIMALLHALELDQCHLLGYSMGGRLALYLAVHYPDLWRSLILESSSPGLETAVLRQERSESDAALAARIEREGIPAFVDFWENIGLFASQKRLETAVRQTLRQQRLQNNPLGLANSLRGMGTGSQPSLWEKLSTVLLPTLLLAGELDSKFVAINQQMVAQMSHAQLAVIPDVGHTIHLEAPETYIQQVLAFLANLSTAGEKNCG